MTVAVPASGQQPATTPQKTNERGSATGRTEAKGHSHPNQYLHRPATPISDNMEPVIVHEDDVRQAREKLAALEARTGKKPNILVFLTDDCGWLDFGFNGGGVAVGNATPNLDRIAAQSLVLTSAYSTPSCTPTRATVLTGQSPLHHGLLRPPMYGEPGGLEGMETTASILKTLGYRTQGVGKWHLGEVEGSLPQDAGFDDYYGFLGVSDMYTEWRDVYFNPEIALSPERTEMMRRLEFSRHNVHCTPAKGVENLYEIDLESIKNLDQDWAAYSERFIGDMAGKDQPFFLYHCTRAAHFDNYPNDEYAGKSRARTTYSDSVVEIDDIFGRLIAKLEETGQLENTLVLFGSDNGPEVEIMPHGRTPFRGSKGTTWEGGVRVPTFVYWKGMVTPRRSEGLFDYADIFNTCISVAGKPGAQVAEFLPAERYTDGIDQVPFLLGDQGQSCRRSIIYSTGSRVAAIRMDEFKLHLIVQLQHAIFPQGNKGGFTGAMVHQTGGLTTVNLYTNPKEDMSVGVRHIPASMPLGNELNRYGAVLAKYPPQSKVAMPGDSK
ncbi:MAG: sulfatase-like hydrolase/transferase [Planctomycetota bacterium]